MLTYNLENRDNKPLYEYLYQCIKNDIETGKIKCGEKLPSKRNLSKHLKLSIITVESAYEQLIAEGYIQSRQRIGYYVLPIATPTHTPAKTVPFAFEKEPEPIIDFSRNAIGMSHFPFSVWAKIMRQTIKNAESYILDIIPFNGILSLRKAISMHLFHFRGMSVEPDQIIIGAGTELLYSLIIQLLGRDKIYALEDPGYQKISHIYEKNGTEDITYINLDEYGVNMDTLNNSSASVLHISPSHHFPTGIVTPISRRLELLEWVNMKSGRYIIEDDYDSEFRFNGKPLPTMQSIDTNDKVIYMNTFSKTLTPSIRVSYMVLPVSLCRTYKKELGFYSCTVSSFLQEALAEFISGGYFEKHINRMKTFYKIQRKKIIESINSTPLKGHSRIKEDNSGLHFLLEIDTSLSDEELKKSALSHGIKLTCLSDYFNDSQNKDTHTLIINYTSIDDEALSHFLPGSEGYKWTEEILKL